MTYDAPVARRQVEITNALGLHLRPAEKFVNLVDRYTAEVRVLYKGQSIDGRSILGLAGLAAERGTRLDLEACGPDAEDALQALVDLVSADFHEDENGQPIGTTCPGVCHQPAPEPPPRSTDETARPPEETGGPPRPAPGS